MMMRKILLTLWTHFENHANHLRNVQILWRNSKNAKNVSVVNPEQKKIVPKRF